MSKDFIVYLHHIKENIDIVRLAQQQGKSIFLNNPILRNGVLHSLQIIGEATKRLPKSYIDQHHLIPWSKIVALRNHIVHYYHGMDFETIWKIVENDLSLLEEFISNELKETN